MTALDQGGRSRDVVAGARGHRVVAVVSTVGESAVEAVEVHCWTIVVWMGMLVWSAGLFLFVRSNYAHFGLARFDLGNMVQAVWSTAHGRPLEVTAPGGDQIVRLALHADPILVLLTPVWLVWPSPLALALVQIVAVALGALPVYGLARRYLASDAVAACLALTYLAYPWVALTAVDAIHPVTFAIPLFLYAIWFLDSGRLWAFAPFAMLAALTGELMGLSVAALGLWYALARGHRKAGFAIAALGAAWSAIAVKLIIPAFLGGPSVYNVRYAEVGGSPEGLLRTAVTDPGALLTALFSTQDAFYWLLLGVPLFGLFLLAPGLAAVALPQLLVNGLSGRDAMSRPEAHYIAGIVPFLVLASVYGLARLSPRARVRWATALACASATAIAFAGAVVASMSQPQAHVQALRQAVSLVPDEAAVTSTNGVGASLSGRRYYYSVPVIGRAEWAVVDLWDARMSGRAGRRSYPGRLLLFRDRLERDRTWQKMFDSGGVLVFRRLA